MEYRIRTVHEQDLESVAQIELVCFPAAEAASRQIFSQRLKLFGDHFYIAESSEKILGFINGCVTNQRKITDDMFTDSSLHIPDGQYQSIFGLDVLPDYEKQGIGSSLMRHMIDQAIIQKRKGLILTCKQSFLCFYESFGYVNLGQSESVHGGAVWYDMMLEL